MNEEFQKYLMGIMEKTGNFLGAEIPEIANQILLFHLAQAILLVTFSFIFMVPCIKYALHYWKIEERTTDEQDICSTVSHVGIVACIIVSVIYAVDILKITLAPKLYLLEYASGLVK